MHLLPGDYEQASVIKALRFSLCTYKKNVLIQVYMMTDHMTGPLPGIVRQTAELCSGPSLRVQPGPTAADDPAQAPKLQHLCPELACPERGPGHRQRYSACPLGSALPCAVLGHTVLEHIPTREGKDKLLQHVTEHWALLIEQWKILYFVTWQIVEIRRKWKSSEKDCDLLKCATKAH